MNFKKITVIALIVSMVSTTALASVLGSETYSSASVEVADGTTYVSNVFVSDQQGVGKQSENYYIYQPNSGIVPVVVNDTYIYGRTKVSDMANKLRKQGMHPLMVMNGDYFSLQTGVQMGHQVIDGVVVSKDGSGQDAVGIRPDGTAFISWLKINTTVTMGDSSFNVECVNKYLQPYSIYMYTDRFSDTTRSPSPSYNVIIGNLSGEMLLGTDVTGVVEEIIESDEPVAIPEGKIVISVDKNIAVEKLANVQLLQVGSEVTVSNTAEGDARWGECSYIQSSVGGRLIKDGEITDTDQAAAPRSAIGVTNGGGIVFYTIDGRQTGHSYGVRLRTLSKRLAELGCIDAINMDGGGSTAIAGVYPGNSDITLLNKPSDGGERAVATFFALMNTRSASGIPEKLFVYPLSGNYLSGATQKFDVKATDTNDHPVAVPGDVTYSAGGGSVAQDDGTVKLMGNGKVTVSASSGEIDGSTAVNVYTTPDNIKLYNSATSKEVKSLELTGGGSVKLNAAAIVGTKTLVSDNSCYEWSCDENIGTIDQSGTFTASMVSATGQIRVRAGNKTVACQVTVDGDEYAAYTHMEFADTDSGVNVKLVSNNGISVEKENISVTVDGKPADFDYKDGVVTIAKNENMTKVMIAVTNSMGKRTIKAYTTGGTAYANSFADTSAHWGRDVISYMNHRKIVNGSPNSDGSYSFNPDNNMTRAEFAVMTANFMNIATEDFVSVELPFADAGQIPAWAASHIKVLYSMGIMNGKTGDDGAVNFDSSAHITRAEVVTVLGRVFGETVKTQELEFTDTEDIPGYSLAGFETMISVGVVGGYSDGSLLPNKNVTRAEAVKMIYGIY